MKLIHKFTSDEKLKWFGHGEWVEEPDSVYFVHNGIECKCLRMCKIDKSGHAFGGHWCGYIKVPERHPWHGHSFDYRFECDVHGGITYGNRETDDWWIGFDCAHLGDLVPSMDHMYKTEDSFKKIRQEHLDRTNKLGFEMPHDHYCNVNYVIEETKNLAIQCSELIKAIQ